jgi:hypothetical protein
MDKFLAQFEERPSWAKDWCYFYLFSAAITALTAVLSLILIVVSFGELNKRGSLGKVALYIVAFLFQSVTSMVMFWMCRSSLKDK